MTFNQWLKEQIKRNDPIGDLARDAARDNSPKPRTLKGWQSLLHRSNACPEVLEALGDAWQEWQAVRDTGEVHSDAEKAYRRGVHQAFVMLGYFLESTDLPLDIVLPEVISKAAAIRGSKQPYPSLLHQLFSEMQRDFGIKQK